MTNSQAASGFHNLKPPAFYFEDPRSVRLLQAVLAGDEKTAGQLVAEGANPNDEGPKTLNANRLRLLHYALAAGNPAAAVALVRLGADPELVAKNYGNAYEFAVNMNDLRVLQLLLKIKPLQQLKPQTVSDLAFGTLDSSNRQAVLGLLLENGMPVDIRDDAEYTLLMRSMQVPDFVLTEWLIRKGADAKVRTTEGMSPAYILERSMERYRPGTGTFQQLQAIRELMAARGASFPAEKPKFGN